MSKTMARIKAGQTVSASRDFFELMALEAAGKIEMRTAPNGQVEFLYQGKPVKVGG